MKAREKLVNEHKLIGMLELDGIPKKRIGEVEIQVVFELDPDFGLTLFVKEKEGGREAKIVF